MVCECWSGAVVPVQTVGYCVEVFCIYLETCIEKALGAVSRVMITVLNFLRESVVFLDPVWIVFFMFSLKLFSFLFIFSCSGHMLDKMQPPQLFK